MNYKNVWAGFVPNGWESGSIEKDRFTLLHCHAKPFALQSCRDTHGCRRCLGWTTYRGERCEACQGTGIGPITGRNFCPICNQASPEIESDPRLVIRPGEMPKPEPKPPAEPLTRPKLTKEEARELAKAQRAEAKAKKAAAKAKAKAKAKKQAKAEKAKAKAAAKGKADREKAKAEKQARPKYVAPWKQVPENEGGSRS